MCSSVNTMCRATPASRAAAGEAFPPADPGLNKTRVRRVTAAIPITTRKMTTVQSKRVARLDAGMKPATRLRLDIDEYFAVFDLDRIRLQLLIGMIFGRASLWIPSPAVPGADHLAVFDHSLSERAALMQALVIHRTEPSPDVGNTDHFPVAGKVPRFVGRGQMSLRNYFGKGHSEI